MQAEDTPPALISGQPKKIFYIDHLKVVVLTILVVLHHAFINFGAPGGWYYTQKTTKIGALSLMTVFVMINQAFFVGSSFSGRIQFPGGFCNCLDPWCKKDYLAINIGAQPLKSR